VERSRGDVVFEQFAVDEVDDGGNESLDVF
jgi:hypothetical protein